MECNKEEAIRAKELAEKKMEAKEFASARRIALKAQRLYPDLKGISQMILICDVHCAAQNKVFGNDSNWYDILQVDPTADEAVIKKQYRKFALSLHPDKNKLTGSSDAFTLIGEAHNVISDNQKRMLFDSRYKAAGKYQASNRVSEQGNGQPNSREHPWFRSNFMNSGTTQSQFMNQKQQEQKSQAQSGLDKTRPTFWTSCPHCQFWFQYYKEALNKTLPCQGCGNSFTCSEVNAPTGTSENDSSKPTFSQQRGPVHQNHSTVVPPTSFKGHSFQTANPGSIKSEDLTRNSFPEKIFTCEVDKESMTQNMTVKIDRLSKFKDSKTNNKKRNKSAESSESSDSESSRDTREAINVGEDIDDPLRQNFAYYSQQNLRRSTRSKQRVSYDENLSRDDDELVKPLKRSKPCKFSCAGVGEVERQNIQKKAGVAADILDKEKEFEQNENLQNVGKEAGETNEKVSEAKNDKMKSGTEIYEYPDPDFCDFDEVRKKEHFAPEQIWAAYDTLDAMPRFYALIRRVFPHDFKLRITWLEPAPDDEDEHKWVNEGLPASCGKFMRGNSENSEDHAMFSHRVIWEKGSGRNIYKIHPRKGETWAMFKDWDSKWQPVPDNKRKYVFEFVEVLSDYADNVGVRVAYLYKLKGFACLFCRTAKAGKDVELIPAKQIFRFSHRVPSFQMTGKEGKNVPPGSFELDPASLPISSYVVPFCDNLMADAELKATSERHDDVRNLVDLGAKSEGEDSLANNIKAEGFASQVHTTEPKVESVRNATAANGMKYVRVENEASSDEVDLKAKSVLCLSKAGKKNCQTSGPNTCGRFPMDNVDPALDVPDAEFYDFDAEKSVEKFQEGQIWAIYSDEDALPRYYGMIKKIEPHPNFGLHMTGLLGALPSKNIIPWSDKKMPMTCGKFKVGRKPKRYGDTSAFSHQVRVQLMDEKRVYSILPQNGDVWALFKDWSDGMTISELETCEYEIVEVLEKNDDSIRVLVLERVHGFNSVFKPQMGEQSSVTMRIPWTELLRFSHQIPAFRLTVEKEGTLRGFWELDPAALPFYLFCLS